MKILIEQKQSQIHSNGTLTHGLRPRAPLKEGASGYMVGHLQEYCGGGYLKVRGDVQRVEQLLDADMDPNIHVAIPLPVDVGRRQVFHINM